MIRDIISYIYDKLFLISFSIYLKKIKQVRQQNSLGIIVVFYAYRVRHETEEAGILLVAKTNHGIFFSICATCKLASGSKIEHKW